jgi:hypothetical protein
MSDTHKGGRVMENGVENEIINSILDIDVGFVYFVEDDTGLVKIGFSKTPGTRVAIMATNSGHVLKMLAYFPGNTQKEHSVHERFKEEHHHGEWFKTSGRISSYIQECIAAGKLVDI